MRDRAVSTVVSYVLILGIVVLMLIGLVGGFAPLVTSQQGDAVRSNLEVFGNDIAGDLESADRLAAASGNGTVELRTRLPDRAGGEAYEISLESTGYSNETGDYRYEIQLSSPDLETPVTVAGRTEAPIDPEATTLDGGTLVITDADGELEVKNA